MIKEMYILLIYILIHCNLKDQIWSRVHVIKVSQTKLHSFIISELEEIPCRSNSGEICLADL